MFITKGRGADTASMAASWFAGHPKAYARASVQASHANGKYVAELEASIQKMSAELLLLKNELRKLKEEK